MKIILFYLLFLQFLVARLDRIIQDNDFYIKEINNEIFKRIKGKSFKDDCTLAREDLRYIQCRY